MTYSAPYGYYQPPPKKRGLKRIIFGILGIIANGIGLFVMPFVAFFIAAIIAAMGGMEVRELGSNGGTFQADAMSVYSVAVPAEDAENTECTFEGVPASDVTRNDAGIEVTHQGSTYVELYDVITSSDAEVQVTCEGASDVGYTEMGMLGFLISLGVGVIIPIALGILAIGLLIWGIVARARS